MVAIGIGKPWIGHVSSDTMHAPLEHCLTVAATYGEADQSGGNSNWDCAVPYFWKDATYFQSIEWRNQSPNLYSPVDLISRMFQPEWSISLTLLTISLSHLSLR